MGKKTRKSTATTKPGLSITEALRLVETRPYPKGLILRVSKIVELIDWRHHTQQIEIIRRTDKTVEQCKQALLKVLHRDVIDLKALSNIHRTLKEHTIHHKAKTKQALNGIKLFGMASLVCMNFDSKRPYVHTVILLFIAFTYYMFAAYDDEINKAISPPSIQINRLLNTICSDVMLRHKSQGEKTVYWRNCRLNFSSFYIDDLLVMIWILKKSGFLCFRDKKEIVVLHPSPSSVSSQVVASKLSEAMQIPTVYSNIEKILDKLLSPFKISYEFDTQFKEDYIKIHMALGLYFTFSETSEEEQRKLIIERQLDPLCAIINSAVDEFMASSESTGHKLIRLEETLKAEITKLLGKPPVKKCSVETLAIEKDKGSDVTSSTLAMTSPEHAGVLYFPPEYTRPTAYRAPERRTKEKTRPKLFTHAEDQTTDSIDEGKITWVNPSNKEESLVFEGDNDGTLKYLGEEEGSNNFVYGYFPQELKDIISKRQRGEQLINLFEKSFNKGISSASGKRIGLGAVVPEYGTLIIKVAGAPRVVSSTCLMTRDSSDRGHVLYIFDEFYPNYHNTKELAMLNGRSPPIRQDATPLGDAGNHHNKPLSPMQA